MMRAAIKIGGAKIPASREREGATLIQIANASLCCAKHNHRAGDHPGAKRIARIAFNDNKAATQPISCAHASSAPHNHTAARHARQFASKGAGKEVAHIAFDVYFRASIA